MNEDGPLIKIINLIKPRGRWDSKAGFFGYALYVTLVALAISSFIDEKIPHSAWEAASLRHEYIFLLAPLALIFYIICFSLRRIWLGVRIFDKINLVIAYNEEGLDGGLGEKYRAFVEGFRNLIAQNDLGDKIKVFHRPLDTKFANYSAAEAKTKLGLAGATLLVWGQAFRKSHKVKVNTSYSFEFNNSGKDKEGFKNKFHQKIKNGLVPLLEKKRGFDFESDYSSLGENLFLNSLFILAVVSNSYNKFDSTIGLLTRWRSLYKKSSPSEKKHLMPVRPYVFEELERAYLGKTDYHILNGDIERARECSQKIVEDKPYHYFGNINLALCYELLDKGRLARNCNNKASIGPPNKHYHHIFNKAYFALMDGDFSAGLNHYDSIIAFDHNKMNFGLMLNYLDQLHRKSGNKALLFAQGLVAYYWHDKILSKKVLSDFLKSDFPQGKDMSVLISRAEELIRLA